MTIRCAPPHSPAFLSSPAAVTALAAVGLTVIPQIQPILGRTDQVRNNVGGYVFAKDLVTKVEDFLTPGTTGGTFYITEDRLTVDNASWLIQAIQAAVARSGRPLPEPGYLVRDPVRDVAGCAGSSGTLRVREGIDVTQVTMVDFSPTRI